MMLGYPFVMVFAIILPPLCTEADLRKTVPIKNTGETANCLANSTALSDNGRFS